MYKSISEFNEDWKNESQATQKVLNALTDESLGQAVYPDGRTLGRIARHITLTIPEMMGQTGLVFNSPDKKSDIPVSAQIIAETYKSLANQLSNVLSENWTDAMLDEIIDIYGEKWSRSLVLQVLVRHEIHHRAQITVLMRQAGLKVPGLYGPSKEEWVAYGMPAEA